MKGARPAGPGSKSAKGGAPKARTLFAQRCHKRADMPLQLGGTAGSMGSKRGQLRKHREKSGNIGEQGEKGDKGGKKGKANAEKGETK